MEPSKPVSGSQGTASLILNQILKNFQNVKGDEANLILGEVP